jgi:hypothetical protein
MKIAILSVARLFIVFILYGCAAFLPRSKEVVRVPWDSYQQVQAAYEQVAPNETTVHQLKKVGFDIYSTPNIKILNYLDIAATTQNIKYEDLSAGLAQCIRVRENCTGYQFEPKVISNERYGNFWLDVFNFRRQNKATGWRFKAVFLVIGDVVVEKFWNGDPKIIEDRDSITPLGPFNDAGAMVLRLIP